MNFKNQPLAISPAFVNSIAELATMPRERHSSSFTPAKGSRLVFEELIGILTPEVNAPLTSRLLRYAADDSVAAVVLYVDSPGGLVQSTPELAEAVRRVAKVKPIHVIAENYLASGAMWVAAGATSITASPSTLVGSIGVIYLLIDDSELFKQLGVRVVTVASSELKSVGVPGVEVTPEHVGVLRYLVDVSYAQFESAISRGRKLTGDKLNAVTDASVWYAAGAKIKGLIDNVELFEDAIAKISAKYQPERFFGLTGQAAVDQFLALANDGRSEDDEFLDLEDVLPSIAASLSTQFPRLTAAAREHDSQPRRRFARR